MRNEFPLAIRRAIQACEAGLAALELAGLSNAPCIPPPAGCFELLKLVDVSAESLQPIRDLKAQTSAADTAVERVLLLRSSLYVLQRLSEAPLGAATRELFCKEFEFFAQPPDRWRPHFLAGDVRFKEMAKIATLRRFPAGQMHWEVTGIPRSLLFRAPARSLATMLRAVARLGGFSPVWEMHVNDRRQNSLVLLEGESYRTYYRTARSIELQPHVRGVITGGWFYDPQMAAVTPHLAWMGRSLAQAGAFMIDLGDAPASGSVLETSKRRRKLYEEGKYKPRQYLAVWSRKDLLGWAKAHPEYEKEDEF